MHDHEGPILVTGASGHLGANLVRRLLADGHKLRLLLRPHSDNRAVDGLDPAAVERVHGDLRDFGAVRAAMAGCARVYHCAAKVSTLDAEHEEIYECNVTGTRHVLRAAREAGVIKTVVSGSFSAVGYDRAEPSRPSDESLPYYPFAHVMPYECSKAFVELECLRAVAEGQDVVIATSCAILGGNDFKPSRMGRALCDFANGKLRAYIPGGFEFVAARDIVEGHVLAMERGRTGQKYIFATEFVTLDQMMDLFEDVTGQARPRLRLPPLIMAGIAGIVSPLLQRFMPHVPQRLTPGAIRILRMHRRADCSKAQLELGYKPTGIRQAVCEAYDFFARRGDIRAPRKVFRAPAQQAAPPPHNGHHPKAGAALAS